MKLAVLIAAAITIASPAMAQFPAPGSFNSTTSGPYTYYNGNGWGGQSTRIGPYNQTIFSTPDGSVHRCNSTTIPNLATSGGYTTTTCN